MNSNLASLGQALANHLWQSTAFGLLAWLLTLAFRRNHARVRYAIWLAASIKFLIPFSLLVSVGNLLPHSTQPGMPTVYSAVDIAEEPFAIDTRNAIEIPEGLTPRERVEQALPACLGAIWLLGFTAVLFAWWNRWRIVARTARQAVRATKGRELEALLRLDSGGIPLLMSEERTEPGIFGVFRPVLLWPKKLSEHLDGHHIEAIVAHELTHVGRRDNLTALIHMFVEAAFWFHPFVWWIERQMVKEREQACDEAVVAMGGRAEAYAESLLKTCWFCIESPLPCAAGVTGADLKRRVASIIAGRILLQMTWPRKVLLAVASMLLVALPILLGQQNAAGGMRQTGPSAPEPYDASAVLAAYDVVSVKPVDANAKLTIEVRDTPDGLQATATVCWLVRMAYGGPKQLPTEDSVTGCPDWARTAYFNVQAKMSPEQVAALSKLDKNQQEQRREQMLEALLVDRFKLKVHRETKQAPDYELVVAKGGSKLKESTVPDANAPKGADGEPLTGFLVRNGQLSAQLITMQQLANFLGGPIALGSKVTDNTGLTGKYNITLTWAPGSGTGSGSINGIAMPSPTPDDDSSAPPIFTALQEQLGLKLQRGTGTIDAVVVNHVERPVAD